MMQWLIVSSRMSHNILYDGLGVDRYLCCSDTPGLWRLLERIQTLQKFVESFSPLLCLWHDPILPPVERGPQQLQRVGKTQNTEGQGRQNISLYHVYHLVELIACLIFVFITS